MRFKDVAVPCVPHVESQQTAAGSAPSEPAVLICAFNRRRSKRVDARKRNGLAGSPAAKREGDK